MAPDPLGTVGRRSTKFMFEGNVVHFDPVFEIRPGESLKYSVRARTEHSGQFRFRTELSTPDLPQPLMQEVTTEVYE